MKTKLRNKLQKRAEKVTKLINNKSLYSLRPFFLGTEVYKKLKGSYGATMNPFDKTLIDHSKFREGFNSARKIYKDSLKPKTEEVAV